MKTANVSLIVGILGLLLTACAVNKSLRNDKRYATFIDKKFKTKEDGFLVERSSCYVFDGERRSDFMRDVKPTIDEFKSGTWVNSRNGEKYRLIIPAGTEVQLIDIVHVTNWEAGDSIRWYGVFVNPPEGVGLEKKILLDSDYWDLGDSVPLEPPFIHKKGFRSNFIPVDEDR